MLCRMNREVYAVEFRKPKVTKNCLSSLYQARGACLRPYMALQPADVIGVISVREALWLSHENILSEGAL